MKAIRPAFSPRVSPVMADIVAKVGFDVALIGAAAV